MVTKQKGKSSNVVEDPKGSIKSKASENISGAGSAMNPEQLNPLSMGIYEKLWRPADFKMATSGKKQKLSLMSPVAQSRLNKHPNYALYGSALKNYQRLRDQVAQKLPDRSVDSVQKIIIETKLNQIKKGHELLNNGNIPSVWPTDAIKPRMIKGYLSEKDKNDFLNKIDIAAGDAPKRLKVPFSEVSQWIPDVSLVAPVAESRPPVTPLYLTSNKRPATAENSKTEIEEDVSQYIRTALGQAKQSSSQMAAEMKTDITAPPELLRDLNGNEKKQEIVSAADAIAYYDFQDLRIAWETPWSEVLPADAKRLQLPEDAPLIKSFLPAFKEWPTWVKFYAYCDQDEEALESLLTASAYHRFWQVCLMGIDEGAVNGIFLEYEFPHLMDLIGENVNSFRDWYRYLCSSATEEERNAWRETLHKLAHENQITWSNNIDDLPEPEGPVYMPDFLEDRDYPFKIFTPGTVNYGLLINYRQEWTPGQWQVGDLVKTVPLAPKEVRKFKTVIKEHKKRYRKELEKAQRSRRSEESSTKRAESEIAERAKESMGFKTEAHGGVNFGIWNAGGSTSLGFDSGKESSATKKNFQEAVAKAAREVKSERQIELVDESTVDFETESTIEISNPNDEITVTYCYYELQRQYLIKELIHKVDSVILVAEDVPARDKINPDWIRKYEWILRRVLLDDSFESGLNTVRDGQVVLKEEIKALEERMSQLKGLLRNTTTEIKELGDAVSIAQEAIKANVDRIVYITESGSGWVAGAQAAEGRINYNAALADAYGKEIGELNDIADTRRSALDRAVDDYNKAKRKEAKIKHDLDRLLEHVRDNILYYQQAIWLHEPPDQRYMRLFDREVPFFDYPDGETEVIIEFDEPVRSLDTLEAETPFRVVLSKPKPAENKRLDDIADLNTLLGFKGNYFIFPLRQQSYLNAYMAQDYFGTGGTAIDPDGTGQTPHIKKSEYETIGAVARVWDALSETFKPHFSEPELLSLKDHLAMHGSAHQWQILKQTLSQRANLKEWKGFVSSLESHLSPEESDAIKVLLEETPGNADESNSTTLEWWSRKGKLMTPVEEEIVVPKNGLYLEALVGQHPLLERFKRDHRAMDVKKVEAEVQGQRLENIRLGARLLNLDLEDPQVDKLVEVRGEGVPVSVHEE